MNKLNWGCGSIQPEGWYNVDKDDSFRLDKPGTPYMLNSTDKFSDNFFDIIVAHASIQQVPWHELVDQLKELRRILKPGGVLRISLPDILEGVVQFSLKGNKDWFPNSEEDIDDRFCAWLTWYSTSKTLLTPKALGNKLKEAGFSSYQETSAMEYVYDHPESTDLDTREGEFYFVEAQK